MSLAVVRSRAPASGRAPEVTVEVHLANGLPSFSIVGRPDLEVRESRERVRAALQNCGFDFPVRRIKCSQGKFVSFFEQGNEASGDGSHSGVWTERSPIGNNPENICALIANSYQRAKYVC
jgi:magnesium chelatase family protein